VLIKETSCGSTATSDGNVAAIHAGRTHNPAPANVAKTCAINVLLFNLGLTRKPTVLK
jgi:hypothetical protein